MHVVVLLKRVLDPEIPPSAFAVDPVRREPDVPRAPHVLSIFDGNALEVALRLRESAPGTRVTALSLGPPETEEVLRKALALTVDEAVHVVGEERDLAPHRKVRLLAAAIRRTGPPDLVLCGRQAADWEAGQVGGMLAEALSLPSLPCVAAVEQGAAGLEALQQLESERVRWSLPGPAVLTVTNDGRNALRPAKVRDVLAARGRAVRTIPLAELLAEAAGPEVRTQTRALSLPEPRQRAELLEGGTPEEQAGLLARRLRDLGAI